MTTGYRHKSTEDIILEHEGEQELGDCLYRNYKRLKEYINKRQKEADNRTKILNRHFVNARKENRKNFDKSAVKMFADWGYKFESFDFGGDKELESYARRQRISYYLVKFVLVPIMACFVISIFIGPIIGPIIKEVSSNISKNNGSPEDKKKENCASKLIKYAWDDEDGCQKASFSSRSDCLWSTHSKTYYYDQDTHSYKKYYQYNYDKDLFEYNGSGIDRLSSGDIPDGKLEFYITCSNDGNWYTNEVNGDISNAIRYWINNTHEAVNGGK